jgi:hypothetical protein
MSERRLHASTKRIVVTVTPELIHSAVRRDSAHSMISEAIKEADPRFNHVSSDLATVRFTDPKKRARYMFLTPPIAQQALIMFDQGKKIEPFTFILRRPAQVVLSGSEPNGKRASRKQRGVRPRKPTTSHRVSTRMGGKLPPNAALAHTAGKIRRYGLKQLHP